MELMSYNNRIAIFPVPSCVCVCVCVSSPFLLVSWNEWMNEFVCLYCSIYVPRYPPNCSTYVIVTLFCLVSGIRWNFSNVSYLPPQSIWIATCVACVVLGLDVGLLAGLVFEMATVVIRTQLWVTRLNALFLCLTDIFIHESLQHALKRFIPLAVWCWAV